MRRRHRTTLLTLSARLGLIAGLAVSMPSCAELSPISPNTCGNFVIDADTEDCDGHATEAQTTCAQPGEPHECRYTCSAAAAVDGSVKDACPRGFGCGHDGVCRRASGSFVALGSRLSLLLVHTLRVGDFDGNGSPDLLALGHEDSDGHLQGRLVYEPLSFDPALVLPLPVLVAAPTVGKLDDNATSDLAYAYDKGISIFRGRPDHRIEFAPFPSLFLPDGASLRVMPLDVIPDNPGDELVALIDYKDTGPGLFDLTSFAPSKKELTHLPAGVADLAGASSWGRIDEGAPCPQIVLPFRGQSAVFLFTPCLSAGKGVTWNYGGALSEIALPPGNTIQSGALLVDLDLDKHLDLLIGANGGTFVAWGNGDGTFTSMKPGGQKDTASPYLLPDGVADGATLPLAIASLDGDGDLDYVTSKGVFLSTLGYTDPHPSSGSPWTVAVVGDLNDNGLPDIIAGSSKALNLEFLNNAGGGVFNPSVLPTEGPPAYLAVGDFDGDLVNDVAFSQEFDMAGEARDLGTIAFGAAHGPPSSADDSLHVGEIEQVAAARLAGGAEFDGIADLLLVSPSPSNETDTIFLVRGSSSRALTTSLPLQDHGAASVPIAMAVGRFGDSTDDIVALGEDAKTQKLGLWRVDGFELIALDEVTPAHFTSDEFHYSSLGLDAGPRYGAVIAAGDLNDDGTDEAVVVAPYGEGDGAAVVIADYDAATASFSPRAELTFTAPLSIDSSLTLRDVDGDGKLDMVLLTGSDEAHGDVLVFWSDGRGGFDVSAPSRVHVDGGVVGVGCLPSPVGRGFDLVIASPSGLRLAKPTAERGFDVEPIIDLPGINDIAVADFDRDGVVDIAVAYGDGIQLYRSVPVLP